MYRLPDGATPGTPLQFATTMELGPVALGVLATSYDGRPIKIDGNPDSDLCRGATSAYAQASVLDVYDPDRSQKVRHKVFGEGHVVSSKLTRDDEEVTVAFPEQGVKKLMASLANLEVPG